MSNFQLKKTSLATSDSWHIFLIFSQPVPLRGGLRQGVGILFLSVCVAGCVRCYLLILLQSFQCRGGIISDLCSLCRSQSLGTSHSMILCLGLGGEGGEGQGGGIGGGGGGLEGDNIIVRGP